VTDPRRALSLAEASRLKTEIIALTSKAASRGA